MATRAGQPLPTRRGRDESVAARALAALSGDDGNDADERREGDRPASMHSYMSPVDGPGGGKTAAITPSPNTTYADPRGGVGEGAPPSMPPPVPPAETPSSLPMKKRRKKLDGAGHDGAGGGGSSPGDVPGPGLPPSHSFHISPGFALSPLDGVHMTPGSHGSPGGDTYRKAFPFMDWSPGGAEDGADSTAAGAHPPYPPPPPPHAYGTPGGPYSPYGGGPVSYHQPSPLFARPSYGGITADRGGGIRDACPDDDDDVFDLDEEEMSVLYARLESARARRGTAAAGGGGGRSGVPADHGARVAFRVPPPPGPPGSSPGVSGGGGTMAHAPSFGIAGVGSSYSLGSYLGIGPHGGMTTSSSAVPAAAMPAPSFGMGCAHSFSSPGGDGRADEEGGGEGAESEEGGEGRAAV